MRASIHPGGPVGGEARVPGDKSIAHRWLILAVTARGMSEIHEPPVALDVRSTARCLSAIVPEARAALDAWLRVAVGAEQPDGFTFNKAQPRPGSSAIALRTRGRAALQVPEGDLDCGNSGTTMRLLAGVLASCPFPVVLTGDESLRSRPMERVAEPLRGMGALVRTEGGRAPIRIDGGPLRGIAHAPTVPSAQVKGAVLLAGLAAEGETAVTEPAPTRDHTERALAHLGAPVSVDPDGAVRVRSFQQEGFEATVPGDVSSAAFLVGAAALTGAELTIRGVGLNPSRIRSLDVMERMGVAVERRVEGSQLGEPVGDLYVSPCGELRGVRVTASELPLVIDEVPILAALAAHARGDSWFLGAAELRVKESDRLIALERAIRALGGEAVVEGEDLVLAGGGLAGGAVDAYGDHRMAMAMCVAALAARSAVEVRGVEAAEVSFPGFVESLRGLGADIET